MIWFPRLVIDLSIKAFVASRLAIKHKIMESITSSNIANHFKKVPWLILSEETFNTQWHRCSGKFYRLQVNNETPLIIDVERNVILSNVIMVQYPFPKEAEQYSLFTTEDGQRWEYKLKSSSIC